MKKILSIIICFLVFGVTATAIASDVIQGKCLEYNQETNRIRVEEFDTNFSADHKYGRSTGIETEFDTSTAQVGIRPEPGDIVRIAFKVVGEGKAALKVMNVSKQDLMNK